MNEDISIKITGLTKKYKLGQITSNTLRGDLQSWWARVRKKEDPNSKIGQDTRLFGTTLMALRGIDLTVHKGEALGIIGGNGAGKSTLLKILTRITAPTDGSIDIYGRVASMLEVGTGFNAEMTGRENIYMNGAILGMTKAEIDAKMEDIIEFSEVRDFIDTPVKRYSSGMYVKLAFAVAAHLDSEIMIMDEVLAVGDMAFQQKCLDKMRSAATVQNKTVLYVSHNMSTIRRLCDRCIVLSEGQIIFDGDVEEAISIYLRRSEDKDTSVIDLEAMERKKVFAQRVKLQSVQLSNANKRTVTRGQKLDFTLNWQTITPTEKLRLRVILCSGDDTPIGRAHSPIIKTADTASFSLDTSLLAEGRYYIGIGLFSNDSVGNSRLLDFVEHAFNIDVILPTDELELAVWHHHLWGNVKFPDIEIVD